MKQLKYFLSLLLFSSLFAQGLDKQNCIYDGKQLFGKIKIVEYDPDITIQIVEHLSDINVKVVEYFPDNCGEWKFVEYFPDLKVKIVNSNADLKVKFVQNFPKIN